MLEEENKNLFTFSFSYKKRKKFKRRYEKLKIYIKKKMNTHNILFIAKKEAGKIKSILNVVNLIHFFFLKQLTNWLMFLRYFAIKKKIKNI